MKVSQVSRALELLRQINRPVLLTGPPGIGKSECVAQLAAKLGIELIDLRAALLDPVDLRGVPHVIKKDNEEWPNIAAWAIPEFLPQDGEGILFLDEMLQAPPMVQNALMGLVLSGRLGEYRLPKGWYIIGAGNRTTDRAGVNRLNMALANRFFHIEFEVDNDDWMSWAIKNGVVTEVLSFLRFRPALLHDFHPERNEHAFPTPRTWEYASDALKQGIDHDLEYEILKGCVGEGATTELLAFLKIYRNLPDPDGIILDPEAAAVPSDPATLYAISGALASRASESNFANIAKYAARIPPEFSVLLVKDAVKRDPAIFNTRAFVQWASDNKDVMI